MIKSLKEAAAFIKVSDSTLYHYVGAKKIKFYKKHGKLYFFESDLIDFIKSGTTCEPEKSEVCCA